MSKHPGDVHVEVLYHVITCIPHQHEVYLPGDPSPVEVNPDLNTQVKPHDIVVYP